MTKRTHIAVLSGAGVSAESGLKTFRDSGGIWEGYRVEEVATPEAWERDPKLVLQFYNERRRGAQTAEPNAAHRALARLETKYDVTVITQNIDNLHERGGSTNVVHLHGEIFKARSTKNPDEIVELSGTELNFGDLCSQGSQLRPHIVWFGEAVPMMDNAISIVERADILIVVGTSLVVYPAASLVEFFDSESDLYVVDRKIPTIPYGRAFTSFEEPASTGIPRLVETLLSS